MFNADSSKIAITIPEFTLKNLSEGVFDSYSEPYILSLAIDSSGSADPTIAFNCMPFPKVTKGSTVRMLGDGHLVYGPKNPGEFVAISILIMECDEDVRNLGKTIEGIVQSKAVELGLAVVIKSNPGSAAIVGILKELTQFVASTLKSNGDDELFRTEGSFLRDHPVPYHINRSYEYSNEYVALKINVIPLAKENGEGVAPIALSILPTDAVA